MEKERIISIAKDVENQPNKDLVDARDFLIEEFNKSKSMIIDLTRHIETIEDLYNKVNDELGKRVR
jgi:hypothetical protein